MEYSLERNNVIKRTAARASASANEERNLRTENVLTVSCLSFVVTNVNLC
jgi:hypothetical protein